MTQLANLECEEKRITLQRSNNNVYMIEIKDAQNI